MIDLPGPPVALWSPEDQARSGFRPPPKRPRKSGPPAFLGVLVIVAVVWLCLSGHWPVIILLAALACITRIR